MGLRKWNYETREYEKYDIPDEWHVILYTDNMKEKVNCPHCGEEITYGDSYTSLEFHNRIGLGFPVCQKCYKKEWERRRKYKGEA